MSSGLLRNLLQKRTNPLGRHGQDKSLAVNVPLTNQTKVSKDWLMELLKCFIKHVFRTKV